MTDFNEKSTDAMFSRIMAKLEEGDRKYDILIEQGTRVNDRLTFLENYVSNAKGVIAGVSAFVSAGIAIAWEYITRK